jgi:hypothetical protein
MLLATNLNYILWVIAKNRAELFYFEKVERLVHFKLKHHTRISTFLNFFHFPIKNYASVVSKFCHFSNLQLFGIF